MKTVVVATIAKNGVIGRTKKPCEACDGTGEDRGAAVIDTNPPLVPWCRACRGSSFVPANDLPWPPYEEDREHFKAVTTGHDTRYVTSDFAEALPVADELVLTLVNKEYEGDVLFPGWAGLQQTYEDGGVFVGGSTNGPYAFKCVSRAPCHTNPELTFTRWVRR